MVFAVYRMKIWNILATIFHYPTAWVSDLTLYCMQRDWKEFMSLSSYNPYTNNWDHPFSQIYQAFLMSWWYCHKKMLNAHRYIRIEREKQELWEAEQIRIHEAWEQNRSF